MNLRFQVYLLKSIPLRLYVNFICFNGISLETSWDWTKVNKPFLEALVSKLALNLIFSFKLQSQIGRLHCLYPWWEDATVSFMTSGGYNVTSLIKKVLCIVVQCLLLFLFLLFMFCCRLLKRLYLQVSQKTLILWGEDDQIISNTLAWVRFCYFYYHISNGLYSPKSYLLQCRDCTESYRTREWNKYQTVDTFPRSKNRLLSLN